MPGLAQCRVDKETSQRRKQEKKISDYGNVR
nr:MAG TPA: hypothetical protein [Caudoviricetes sp.]